MSGGCRAELPCGCRAVPCWETPLIKQSRVANRVWGPFFGPAGFNFLPTTTDPPAKTSALFSTIVSTLFPPCVRFVFHYCFHFVSTLFLLCFHFVSTLFTLCSLIAFCYKGSNGGQRLRTPTVTYPVSGGCRLGHPRTSRDIPLGTSL